MKFLNNFYNVVWRVYCMDIYLEAVTKLDYQLRKIGKTLEID